MKRVENILLNRVVPLVQQHASTSLQRLSHNASQSILSTTRNICDTISLNNSTLSKNVTGYLNVGSQRFTSTMSSTSSRLGARDSVEINNGNNTSSNVKQSTLATYKPTMQQNLGLGGNGGIVIQALRAQSYGCFYLSVAGAREQVDDNHLRQIGLNNIWYRQFSTKTNNMSNIALQRIQTGGDFEKLVTQSTIFVDKSLFIKEVFNDPSEVILITMPRRWGKSINIDMLKRFLEIKVDDNGNVLERVEELNYKLFAGGKVNYKTEGTRHYQSIDISTAKITSKSTGKEIDAMSLQGLYPVIFIDFKSCKGSSVEEVKFNLNKKITDTIENFGYLAVSKKIYKGITTIGQKYNEILNSTKSGIFKEAIKDLSSLLHSYHEKKVWILIDEYDAAANKAYLEFSVTDAKTVLELFRDVFESALKGNDHIEKGVITGVQYIVKSGMLSGLNNLSKYNITNFKYSQYYGINQEEMNGLLQHFKIEESQAIKIKAWYNGYQENVGTYEDKKFVDKYNIWSVVNYLNRQNDGFKSYWEGSGSIDFIKPLFKHQNFKEKIENLINDDKIIIDKLISDFSVDNFRELKEIITDLGKIEISPAGLELIFSYFFITGYFTHTSMENEYRLPNRELKYEFTEKIKNYYKTIFNISPEKFSELTKILNTAFKQQSSTAIQEIFVKKFGPKLNELIKSVKLLNVSNENQVGLFANESLVHSLLNHITLQIVNGSFASERYTTKTDGTRGRADIILKKNGIGIIIEMKHQGKVEEALVQAKQYSELIKNTNTKIFIGCNISGKQEVFLCGEVVINGQIQRFTYNS